MTLDQRVRINTEADHERAMRRIDELAAASIDLREEAEPLPLLEVVDRWGSHDERWADWP